MLTNTGKQLRLKRIFRKNGKTLIVAMDHSMGGKVPGLEDYLGILQKISKGGADAVIMSYGSILAYSREIPRNLGILMSLTYPQDSGQVINAVKIGADGVKSTFFGSIKDEDSLKNLSQISAKCEEYGIPFLAEVVPMDEDGKLVHDDVVSATIIAAEAGSDFVKTAYTGTVESFKEVTQICSIPVIVMGGEKMDTENDVLKTVKDAINGGGAGIAFGRNIFQHNNPTAMVRAIGRIIHENSSVSEAIRVLRKTE